MAEWGTGNADILNVYWSKEDNGLELGFRSVKCGEDGGQHSRLFGGTASVQLQKQRSD